MKWWFVAILAAACVVAGCPDETKVTPDTAADVVADSVADAVPDAESDSVTDADADPDSVADAEPDSAADVDTAADADAETDTGGPSWPAPEVTFTLPGPGGDGGMYIPDVQAKFPDVDWQELDRLYIPAGQYKFIRLGNLPDRSPDDPLIITNKDGQVWVGALGHYYMFVIGGGSNWVLTGRYDAAAATGHEDYPGHAGGYAGSRHGYGIMVDDEFVADSVSGIGVGGGATDFEIEFVEITRVGFAGMSLKTDDDGDAHMTNVRIHDVYIHDTGSEGIYMGSTQTQPQHRIMGLKFYNNRVVRCGTEMLQVGQVGGGTEIHHNVFLLGGLDWKDPFQAYQDNASQLAPRMGSVEVHHNVFIGGADTMLNMHPMLVDGDTHAPGDIVHIHDNVYSHGRHLGVYLGQNPNGETTYRFENNRFRAFVYQYDEINPGKAPNTELIRVHNAQSDAIEVVGNTWEGGLTLVTDKPNVTQSGNVEQALPPVTFVDSGFADDVDWMRVEIWTATAGANGDAPVSYSQGDFVMVGWDLYECVAPGEHTGVYPPDNPDVWEKKALPPDDLRTPAGSPYAGIGLLDPAP